MKLFTGVGPNPRVVTLFVAERGADVEVQEVDLMGGENREAAHLARNPAGQLPTLELDNGSFLSEITAICEYLDEVTPGDSLIGSTPEERAETRMWVRRIDLNIIENMANGFRFAEGIQLFEGRIRTIPQAADDLKATARERLEWLDGLMEGKEFICGDRLTLADILLFAFLEFGNAVGQPLDAKCERLQAWYERMAARPSVTG
ncbi:MAG: glutathione S-transferase family protein [Deltaproteobacteria bacterium]|jgi:glutathione S-transferase|nr:glutathione S-transferase family protein [Deltaproteobacteria bacterium]MBW2495676.1 glutathione S-transferase family protein [Deltaproteobacteria bacterium]